MKHGMPQERINNAAHRHYQQWYVGDGVKTEFALPKTIQRLDQLMVTYNKTVFRPDENAATLHDYAVRGITPGYAGDANFVKFHAAPAVGADVGFFLNAD